MKYPYRLEICFTWLIILATPGRTRRAVSCSTIWLMKAKLAGALVVGIADPLLSLMIVGTLVAKLLVKLASLIVKSVAFGVSCDTFKLMLPSYFLIFAILYDCLWKAVHQQYLPFHFQTSRKSRYSF
jgi:hypothetical protein